MSTPILTYAGRPVCSLEPQCDTFLRGYTCPHPLTKEILRDRAYAAFHVAAHAYSQSMEVRWVGRRPMIAESRATRRALRLML